MVYAGQLYTFRSCILSADELALTINVISYASGKYMCVGTFSDSPSGTTIQPGSVPPVVIGQSVDLVCTATGDPPISFTWVLMGEENTRLNSDPTSGNFTLNITQVNQYGVYICITTNNLGTDAASVDIIQASKYIIQSIRISLIICTSPFSRDSC